MEGYERWHSCFDERMTACIEVRVLSGVCQAMESVCSRFLCVFTSCRMLCEDVHLDY